MACPEQVFNSISAEQFALIVDKAAAAGININGHAGEMSRAGFSVRWEFEPATRTFTIQCIERPFLISCAAINNRIQELVRLVAGDGF